MTITRATRIAITLSETQNKNLIRVPGGILHNEPNYSTPDIK